MKHCSISPRRMRVLPKVQIHEHLDCSLRPRTMLELWDKRNFDSKMGFPDQTLKCWQASNRARSVARKRELRRRAVTTYQKHLVGFASESLANYVQAIVDHVLPLMQSEGNLTRIMKERIEDAVKDGHIAIEIRFAPQLHTFGGLTLDQVMDAVIKAVDRSPIPVDLTVCALRHENGEMAAKLVDICMKYRKYVGCFDLAADEAANPGVLDWWLKEAIRLRDLRSKTERPIKLKCHLWETNEPTDDDIAKLESNGINIVGHGVRGYRQGNRVLEICPTSNVVTAQFSSIANHPIDRLHKDGYTVTVNTDGTLFTETDLTREFLKLQEAFGWRLRDFRDVTYNAIRASNFADDLKAALAQQVAKAYAQ